MNDKYLFMINVTTLTPSFSKFVNACFLLPQYLVIGDIYVYVTQELIRTFIHIYNMRTLGIDGINGPLKTMMSSNESEQHQWTLPSTTS